MVARASNVPLVESTGNELAALLSPISPETFVREYWARKPLFVKGFPDKYKGLFTGETFMRVLSAPGPAPDDFLHASFDKGADSRSPDEWASVAFKANLEEAEPLFKAGATLCVTQIETRVPDLAPFPAAIKRQLGYPGKVYFNAYRSPPAVGFNWHFDARIATTLQIEGTKRWRFSNRPAVPWPRSNGALRANGTGEYTDPLVQQLEATGYWQIGKDGGIPFDERDTTEVLLEPGDLLILPAGVWHDACAGADGSLALNLSFAPIPYTLLVRNLLDAILTPDPSWRGPSPVLPMSGGAPGEVDPGGIAAIKGQLLAAADALRSLAGDSAAVVRLWGSFVQNPNPGFAAPLSPPVSPTPVRPDQRLRVRADGSVYPMLADGGSRLCIRVGTSGAMEFIEGAIPFVQRLLVEKEFVASDCAGWIDDGSEVAWSDIEMMLTKLKGDGLIEDVPVTDSGRSGSR
ncbi:MAG TPA: cupin domain-containing protein [Polyangiaceae bacterium]|nr:cupin domain-containing protein [Polyangiaceae bacterium]